MFILQGNMPLIWWSICVFAIMLLIIFPITISLYRRIKRFESSYITLQTFMSGQELETLFQEYIQKVAKQGDKLEECDKRLSLIELKMRAGVDRAELLRFRAFENTGSDLSFAFALLNQQGDGVVLSSIHNREESRIYAKPIKEGSSTYQLTDEEKEVINRAMQGERI